MLALLRFQSFFSKEISYAAPLHISEADCPVNSAALPFSWPLSPTLHPTGLDTFLQANVHKICSGCLALSSGALDPCVSPAFTLSSIALPSESIDPNGVSSF